MSRDTAASTANLTRDETAERSRVITLDAVDVELDLTDARTIDTPTFPTTATLSFRAEAEATWIDFLGTHVDEVVVNGETRIPDWDGARVYIDALASENIVTIRGRAAYSRSGEGLHRFVDPVDGETYLYTQYEPADCRRVYPCFEQPDMKARWRFRVAAPSGWQILSNGAETHRQEVDGGVLITFAETLPLSSYITAIAAGPYHRVNGIAPGASGDIALGVLCRASFAAYLDAEEILDVTRRGIAYFEDAFASPYPWGKYDQVFVPEYNLGAMENPGLVTFTEAYLFRGAATAAQHEARANTILHEMAHMWFGDLVTMRWWDDLWLKESFADFMGAHVAVTAGGYPEAWITFASRRKGWAYEQDQLPTTHPIVADIGDLEAAKLNFDGITYAKGASVLKQLVAYVGEEAFLRGAQRYFADHAYGNTTLDDLLRALETASGRDLREWSGAWLETTGMSEIRVDRASTGPGAPSGGLTVVQTDPRPHRLSVGLYTDDAGRLVRRGGLEVDVTGQRTAIDPPFIAGADLILPNDDDRTYAKVRLDAASLAAVERGLSSMPDGLARSVVWAALWNAVRDGELPVTRYLDIVTRHAPRETSVSLLADALAHADFAIAHYCRDADRPGLSAAWLDTVWTALHAAAPSSDAQLAWARALGTAAARSDGRAHEVRALLAATASPPEGLTLDPDLRWAWTIALATTGHLSDADLDAELTRDPTASGRRAHRTAASSFPDAAVRAGAWRAAWEDDTLTNDLLDATIAGVRAGGRRDLIADLDLEYFSRIREVWQTRSIEIARRLVRGLFPASASLTDADAWLAAHEDAPGALRRIVIEQRDGLRRALHVRAAQPASS